MFVPERKDQSEELFAPERKLERVKNVFDTLSDEESPIEENEFDTFFIYETSLFYKIWENYIYGLIIYTIIITPIRLAFFDSFDKSVFPIIDIIVDSSYIIEIVLNFFIVYKDKNEAMILNRSYVALNYLNSYLLFDLFCAFPFGYINMFIKNDIENDFFRKLTYIAWLRMIRIAKLKKLSNIHEKSDRDTISNRRKKKIYKVLKISLLLISTIHIFSCFFVFLAKSSLSTDNWITKNELEGFVDIYTASFYFHFVTMYSIGYGDILAVNSTERVYNNIFMFISVMVYSFLISVSANYFNENDQRIRLFVEKIKTLDKKDPLKESKVY